jgi:hypothetical protein
MPVGVLPPFSSLDVICTFLVADQKPPTLSAQVPSPRHLCTACVLSEASADYTSRQAQPVPRINPDMLCIESQAHCA